MSDDDDQQHLLANMDDDAGDDNDDSELDNDAQKAIQQMMGFSSFGGPQKPKRQPRGPGGGNGFGTGE